MGKPAVLGGRRKAASALLAMVVLGVGCGGDDDGGASGTPEATSSVDTAQPRGPDEATREATGGNSATVIVLTCLENAGLVASADEEATLTGESSARIRVTLGEGQSASVFLYDDTAAADEAETGAGAFGQAVVRVGDVVIQYDGSQPPPEAPQIQQCAEGVTRG